jgi:capsular polysaccharide biosynthesis protein
MYLLLKNKYEEYRIAEAVKAAGVTVIDRAITPRSPVKPKKKLNVAIGGFLGVFVGLGLVFVLEFLDTTLKSAEDVERWLELPVLGRIPEVDVRQLRSSRRSRRS